MTKYGCGIGNEIVKAINKKELPETICTDDIKEFCKRNNWNVPDTYLNVFLANSSAETHSPTYKKYFIRVSEGRYKLAPEFIKNK